MSIHNLPKKIKSSLTLWFEKVKEYNYQILIISVLVTSSISAFVLGYFSRGQGVSGSTVIISCEQNSSSTYKNTQNLDLSSSSDNSILPSKDLGNFVASGSGKKYYPINCTMANKIKISNRIYFKSEQDAINAGYSRALNCK